jgi:hypothetical protein
MKAAFLKNPLLRRGAIAVLAVVTAAGVVAGREKAAVEPVEPSTPRLETAAPALEIDLARLQRAEAAAPQADPFAPKSFAPPPVRHAAVAAAPAAEAPSVPPLPFAYAGKLTQDGRTEVFVLRGEELISIAAGQNIDAEYRVEAIGESQIAFTYLPLRTRQSLEVAEAGG